MSREMVVLGKTGIQRFISSMIVMLLCWGLVACGGGNPASQSPPERSQPEAIAEAAPPLSIRTLEPKLAAYQPQVQILTPEPSEVLTQTQVAVTLAVQDLPIFKDEALQLGLHLQVSLDNQPARSVYSLDEPLLFEDVSPGTHLLRAFAVTPWGESFKNEGAYAQTQFAVLTPDRNNRPNPNLPLLTYNSPEGVYSAQPLLLDFFLTNAPLQWSETAALDPASTNWRIRVTANGQSFILDDWQSLYLEGFQPGLNWVELEFLGPDGQPIDNVLNNTVRIVNYQPEAEMPLATLTTNVIPASERPALIDPDYRDRLRQATAAESPEELEEDEVEPSDDAPPLSESEVDRPNAEDSEEFSPESLNPALESEDEAVETSPDLEETAATEQADAELPVELLDEADADEMEPAEATTVIPETVVIPETEILPLDGSDVAPVEPEVVTEPDTIPESLDATTDELSIPEELTLPDEDVSPTPEAAVPELDELPLILDEQGEPVGLPTRSPEQSESERLEPPIEP